MRSGGRGTRARPNPSRCDFGQLPVKDHFGETPKSTPETGALPGSKPSRITFECCSGAFATSAARAAPAAICCFLDFAGTLDFGKNRLRDREIALSQGVLSS
jgi:hypothetical protein